MLWASMKSIVGRVLVIMDSFAPNFQRVTTEIFVDITSWIQSLIFEDSEEES